MTPTCWRIYWSCSGTHKPPSWLPFSGFLSKLYLDSLSLLVMLVSVSILSFEKETVLYFLCLWGSHRLRQLLSKEFFTVASRRHNDKPRRLYFLSLPSLTLSICSFCRSTLLWLAMFSLSFFSFTFWRNKSFVLLARCHFFFFFPLKQFLRIGDWLLAWWSWICDMVTLPSRPCGLWEPIGQEVSAFVFWHHPSLALP